VTAASSRVYQPDHPQRSTTDSCHRVVEWTGRAATIVHRLGELGSGVGFIACEHAPSSAAARDLHYGALISAFGVGPFHHGRFGRATETRIGMNELFGWAYDREAQRLLRPADNDSANSAQVRRWEGQSAPGYGPFVSPAGDDDHLVWIDDLWSLQDGFACLLLSPRASPSIATEIEALAQKVDKLILGSPADDVEAFRWQLADIREHSGFVGYDAWTVRTSSQRIVVVRERVPGEL
jgi:hypothetical protein